MPQCTSSHFTFLQFTIKIFQLDSCSGVREFVVYFGAS